MKTKKKKIRTSLSSFQTFYSEYSSVIKESFIALLICALGDLFAGIILGNMTFFLQTFPGLLVIIPGAIGMRGNIFGSFASRISTNLHIGLISPKFEFSEHLNNNIISSFVLTLILSLFLAIAAKLFCILLHFESMSLMDFILISIIAGIISNLIMLPITMIVSFKSFNHGWDPDNITTPIIAAAGDLLTLPAIIASVYILTFLNFNLLVKDIIFIIIIVLIIFAFIYAIKMSSESKDIITQSTPVLLLCSLLGVSAGAILNNSLETLLTNHSLLTLLPLFSGMCGSLVSILSSRLSSGFISEDSTILLGLTGVGFINIILISLISGFILISIMIFVVYYISITSYNHNLDPDNIVIPISASFTDAISSLIIISVSLLILGALI